MYIVLGSCISGDVTPVSAASDLEFNSNEATAGSGTDHDLLVRQRTTHHTPHTSHYSLQQYEIRDQIQLNVTNQLTLYLITSTTPAQTMVITS